MKIERRTVTFTEVRVETREVAGKKQPVIRGHAAVFNQLSENLGGFREQIMPGAFAGCLGDDVRALFNHNPDYVLGRSKSGTLRLSEDATGLAVEIDPPDTQFARDLQVSMSRGDINQMSFGFTCQPGDDDWSEDAGGMVIRTLRKVSRLYDVSPVTYPAYPQTDVAMRSLDAWKAQQKTDTDGIDAALRAYDRANKLIFGPA